MVVLSIGLFGCGDDGPKYLYPTPPLSYSGIYNGTIGSNSANKYTLFVDEQNLVTCAYNYNGSGVLFQGSLNTNAFDVTASNGDKWHGDFSATGIKISVNNADVSVTKNASIPTASVANPFKPAMLQGHSFTLYSPTGDKVYAFSATGNTFQYGTTTGYWYINPNGMLTLMLPSGIMTYTIDSVSNTNNNLFNLSYVDEAKPTVKNEQISGQIK